MHYKNGHNNYEPTWLPLPQLLATFPPGETTLNLSYRDLGKKAVAEILEILALTPAQVNSLDLSWNDFGKLTGTDLATLFFAISTRIISLTLSLDSFDNKTTPEIVAALAKLRHVKLLKLRATALTTMDDWAKILAILPITLQHLDLSGNMLEERTNAAIAQLLAVLPTRLNSLKVELSIFKRLPQLINRADDVAIVFKAHQCISYYFHSQDCTAAEQLAFRAENDAVLLEILYKHLEYFFDPTEFDPKLSPGDC